MPIIFRALVVFFSFLLACFAGGIVVTAAVIWPEWSDLALGPMDSSTFAVFASFGFIFVSGFALMPAVLAIAVAEFFSIRSVLFYALCGALIGFVAYASLGGFDPALLRYDTSIRREIEIMVGAGIVAGFVYWLFAGRKAGRWREPSREPPASA